MDHFHDQMHTSSEERFASYAFSIAEAPAVDMHEAVARGDLPAMSDPGVKGLRLSTKWMPFAAEAYNVSPNLSDYVVVPVTIFLTDLPNTNLCAFPFDEMSKWNPKRGCISYETWRGMPTFVEHANKDHTKAKGMILDAMMRPAPEFVGNLYRVVLLSGWDRSRYPEVAGKMLTQQSAAFSMGAWVDDYECSACGGSMRAGGCQHMNRERGVIKRTEGNRLVYRMSRGVAGFELSNVATPAWRGAVAQPFV